MIPAVLKYLVDVRGCITKHLNITNGSLAMVGNLFSDSVMIKILVGSNLKTLP